MCDSSEIGAILFWAALAIVIIIYAAADAFKR